MTEEELRLLINRKSNEAIRPLIEQMAHIIGDAYEKGMEFGTEIAHLVERKQNDN